MLRAGGWLSLFSYLVYVPVLSLGTKKLEWSLECQSFTASSYAWIVSEVSICLGQTCLYSIELWLLLL